MQYSDYLYHHGIKGQKWGIRRFQNSDGTYTEAGKKRYHLSDKQKNAIKIGAAVVGTVLLAYGGHRLTNTGSFGKSIVNKTISDSSINNMQMSMLNKLSKYQESARKIY